MKRRDPRTLVPDFDLWAQVAKTVDPLRPQRRPAPERPLPLPEPSQQPVISSGSSLVRQPFLAPYQAPIPVPAPHHGRIQPDLHKRLARGRVEIDARLDLHGMRVEQARTALLNFVHARLAQGARTLLVITGKGEPGSASGRGILRTMLPIWLAEPSLAALVSGYGPAARSHGGDGAFYIRLKNPVRGPR